MRENTVRAVFKVFCLVALHFSLASDSQGQWVQWRGNQRDGCVSPNGQKQEWPDKLKLRWQHQVGMGYSGPVSDGDLVWVHSRQGENEVVSCYQLSDGKQLWIKRDLVPFKQDPDARVHGKGPFSTPALHEDVLLTLSITSKLAAWNAVTGNRLWTREAPQELKSYFPYFGAASSPLAWQELCFISYGGHGRGETSKGAMVAMRISDGTEIWRWDKEGPSLGASPIIGKIDNTTQLIFKTVAHIVGLHPLTGDELWSIPFKVNMDNTIVTPLLYRDTLLTSDYEKGFYAWRIFNADQNWQVQELWTNSTVSLFTCSPVIIDDQIVALSHYRKGQLCTIAIHDGRLSWRGKPRTGEHASLICSGRQILVFTEDGRLQVGDVSDGQVRMVQQYKLGHSGMWAHPAVLSDVIILRDRNHLLVYNR